MKRILTFLLYWSLRLIDQRNAIFYYTFFFSFHSHIGGMELCRMLRKTSFFKVNLANEYHICEIHFCLIFNFNLEYKNCYFILEVLNSRSKLLLFSIKKKREMNPVKPVLNIIKVNVKMFKFFVKSLPYSHSLLKLLRAIDEIMVFHLYCVIDNSIWIETTTTIIRTDVAEGIRWRGMDGSLSRNWLWRRPSIWRVT